MVTRSMLGHSSHIPSNLCESSMLGNLMDCGWNDHHIAVEVIMGGTSFIQ